MKCLIDPEMDCINNRVDDETGCLICEYFLKTLKKIEKENEKINDNLNKNDELP